MRPRRYKHSLYALLVTFIMATAIGITLEIKPIPWTTSDLHSLTWPSSPSYHSAILPLTDQGLLPTPQGISAQLAHALTDPNLGHLSGQITDAITGKILWQYDADRPMQPASTNKLLTAAAALLTLDPQQRITTSVFSGADPMTIVLMGAGDPTLSAALPDQETWYRGAARISDLAQQIQHAGVHPTNIQVDISAFQGPTMAHGWDPNDIEGGDVAPIEAIMIDAGRIQPTTINSTRSHTPALDAGKALAQALGIDPQHVTVTGAVPHFKQIASVHSAPLSIRLTDMMNRSDNVMAECIGREIATQIRQIPSFSGAVNAVLSQLRLNNISVDNATLYDSSGLSVDDRLTASALDAVIQAANNNHYPSLRLLLDTLPIAAGSGTLANRFTDPISNHGSAGWLRAKTGSLTGTNALVGVITDRDWRVLTFAFLSNNAGPTGRVALDELASTLYTCGCSAS